MYELKITPGSMIGHVFGYCNLGTVDEYSSYKILNTVDLFDPQYQKTPVPSHYGALDA